MRHAWLFVFLFNTTIGWLEAQPAVDLAQVRFQSFSDDHWTTHRFSANLFAPIENKKHNVYLLGAAYDQLVFDPHDSGRPGTNLTSVSLQLGHIKKWDQTWSTMVMVVPKINSGFEDLSSKDLQLGGVLVMTKAIDEKLKYKFGIYYNREFFGNYFIPLIGIDWKVSNRLNLFGLLPGNFNLEYRICSQLYAGVAYQSITSSFRLNGQPGKYMREGHKFWGHNQAKVFIHFYPVRRVMVYAEYGRTAFRKYTLHESDGQDVLSNPLAGIHDHGFFSFGASYRIRLED